MLVAEFQEREGLTDEQMAERLAIQPRGYRGMKNREMPERWAKLLGVDFDEQAAAVERERFTVERPQREKDTEPPRAPEGADVRQPQLPATVNVGAAQERIQAVYGGLGHALAVANGNPGLEVVTDDMSPTIARCWVKAAEEGNPLAKRLVALIGSGGTMGELVTAHVVWVMGLAYVSGRSDFDPLGSFGRKYGQHRPAVEQPVWGGADVGEDAAQAAAGVDGPGSAAPLG